MGGASIPVGPWAQRGCPATRKNERDEKGTEWQERSNVHPAAVAHIRNHVYSHHPPVVTPKQCLTIISFPLNLLTQKLVLRCSPASQSSEYNVLVALRETSAELWQKHCDGSDLGANYLKSQSASILDFTRRNPAEILPNH